MLKPIHRVPCSPALLACQHLMQRFALWLCDPSTSALNVTSVGLQPPVMPSAIEADWLWNFLQGRVEKRTLLDRALVVAAMPTPSKADLCAWVRSVSALDSQFQPVPATWPVTCPLTQKHDWKSFKTLMEAFYEKGFRAALPYLDDGTPAVVGCVSYAHFVRSFRERHRLSAHLDAREICVFCGGPLGDTPPVDHWIAKSEVPLLSMCETNLTVVCGTCNGTTNKGSKPVHIAGSFMDWFHPHFRPGHGAIQLGYNLHARVVHCSAVAAIDQARVVNLDGLLNLTSRWTRKFKAEYANQQGVLTGRERQRVKAGQPRHTQQEIEKYFQQWAADLLPSEPDHEVDALLGQAMQEPARVKSWLTELQAIQ